MNEVPVYDCPEYSSEIAAAWEVVERMKERGLGMALEVNAASTGCVFGTGACLGDDLSGPMAIGAESAPLAICLAALKAVGHPA